MRRGSILVLVLVFPLASGLITNVEMPEIKQNLGYEIIIDSKENQWTQSMWDDLEQYGISLIREENRVIVDTLQWNGNAKKSGFETGDYISELKIENIDRPNKVIIYPIAFLMLIIFGYLNFRRRE